MENDLEVKFKELQNKLSIQFDGDLDVQGIIYLVGVQELGQGPKKYSKKEKMDLMHVAVCAILEPYGYFEYIGKDKDGWLHFEDKQKLPQLSNSQQLKLIKQGLIDYFERTA
ncbi:hypothetical protein N9V83_03640 [Flavobacteriales bacterium]|jgi:hypothetical protein|nr:hypothetical protein [Flavobacteriales bacterium]MDC6465022.1 hypothetical protein [bacterium]